MIHVFDTAAHSDNLGDQIIMESVWDILHPLFPGERFRCTPSHRYAPLADLLKGRSAEFSIVGGTNILKSHMLVRGNWRITPLDYLAWRNVVLLGVGWQQYGGETDAATRLFLRSVLARNRLQSVRDIYTFDKLQSAVPNVVYTSCPTTWQLDRAVCARIPVRKARHAIFAVTYYRPAPEADRRLFALLQRLYEKVYFWPQQADDVRYVRELGLTRFIPIAADVGKFNQLLDEEDVDFVGARLHGGIRALQRGRRALVIPVDNRATEMGRSTRLPVISRDEPDAIEAWINAPQPTTLDLPWDGIARWRNQFRVHAPEGASAAR